MFCLWFIKSSVSAAELSLKLKPQENNIRISPNLTYDAIAPPIDWIWSFHQTTSKVVCLWFTKSCVSTAKIEWYIKFQLIPLSLCFFFFCNILIWSETVTRWNIIHSNHIFYFVSSFRPQFVRLCIATREIVIIVLFYFVFSIFIDSWVWIL